MKSKEKWKGRKLSELAQPEMICSSIMKRERKKPQASADAATKIRVLSRYPTEQDVDHKRPALLSAFLRTVS
jgi:hypothetical protein